MKVVIFCGGMGIRMLPDTETIPKPMIAVGTQPILWHIMKWYASWGHKDFVLCLGYQAEQIKDYFLHYQEALVNDFVLTKGGRDIELLGRDLEDWRITFVDTGARSSIGERMRLAQPHLGDDAVFLATYGDGLSDAPLDQMIATLEDTGKTGLFLAVKPRVEYHVIRADQDGVVESVDRLADADIWINGGFFVFRSAIFDAIEPGDDLVTEPFARLIERRDLLAYRHKGFWEPMDTMKDKQKLDSLIENGTAPWIRPEGRAR